MINKYTKLTYLLIYMPININNIVSAQLVGKLCSKNIEDDIQCIICRENLDENNIYNLNKINKIVTGKCNHSFHTECIKQWLSHTNIRCPQCFIKWEYK